MSFAESCQPGAANPEARPEPSPEKGNIPQAAVPEQHQQPPSHPPLPASVNAVPDPDFDADNGNDDESIDGPAKLPYSKWRSIALVATVTGASFTNRMQKTLSVQSVVIILPSIGRDLGIPDARLQWIVSAYALTFGCFLILWGRIADVFGKKAIFVAGSAWVTATTVANPFVPNEVGFDLFRGLQGLGAAANVPTAIGILGTTFPPGKAKNYAFAAYGAGAPLGSIFGNLLAGVITSYANWKWVFGVLAILSGVVTVIGYLVIPAQPPPVFAPRPVAPSSSSTPGNASPVGAPPPTSPVQAAFRSIDWLGGFLVTLGLVGLLFALTEGNVVGWSTPWVGVLIAVSCLLVAAFVLWQLWLERPRNVQRRQRVGYAAWPPPPLVRMSIFSHSKGPFGTALVIMALFFSSFNGFLVYATYFYQDYQGLSAIQTTLRFIPTGIVGVLTCFVVARLLSRVPTYLILLFGNVSVTVASLLFAVPIPADSTSFFAYGLEAMVLSVLGADTAWPSLTLFVSRALPAEDQALGGALVNMAGQVGRAVGLAIATAVQTAVMASARGRPVDQVGPTVVGDRATLLGLRAGNYFNCALGVCSSLVVLVAFRGSGIVGKVPDRPAPAPLRPAAAAATDIEEVEDSTNGAAVAAAAAAPAGALPQLSLTCDVEKGMASSSVAKQQNVTEISEKEA